MIEINKEDIEDLQDNEVTKQYVDNSINAVYGNVYTRDQANTKFSTKVYVDTELNKKQDTLAAGNNIVIDSSNEISVATNPIFNNVSIDNDSYYSNNFQGTVIEYNESGDNDDGWIKMNANNPELYSYNDHLHGEYGNESRLRMLEDIQVYKSGYSDYPDGYYAKTYNLIDTLEDHANKLNNTVQLTFTFSGGTTQTYDVVIKPSNNS